MTMPDELQATQAAEFAALATRAADELPPDQAPEQPAAPVLDWAMASAGLVGVFAVYADNWALTADEQNTLATHLCATLNLWFPDVVMSDKWQAVAALGMVAGGVAMTRLDPVTRRLQPLRKPREPATDAPA